MSVLRRPTRVIIGFICSLASQACATMTAAFQKVVDAVRKRAEAGRKALQDLQIQGLQYDHELDGYNTAKATLAAQKKALAERKDAIAGPAHIRRLLETRIKRIDGELQMAKSKYKETKNIDEYLIQHQKRTTELIRCQLLLKHSSAQ